MDLYLLVFLVYLKIFLTFTIMKLDHLLHKNSPRMSLFIQNIFLCQKRAIRIVAGLEFKESTKKDFSGLKLLKIGDLLKYNLASVMWDHDLPVF